jgi:hypothetical protein
MKSLSFYPRTLLVAAICIMMVSCTKEYSVDNASPSGISGGTAVYTLAGSDGNCTSPTINGTYAIGNVMQSSNTVLLYVNVSAPGTYVIVTNIANGVQFTAGGVFTVAGPQTIQLKANGIPSASGNFQYNPPVGTGCAFLVNFS